MSSQWTPLHDSFLSKRKKKKMMKETARVELLPVFSDRNQRQYFFLTVLWLSVSGFFWTWWLSDLHIGSPILFFILSATFFYNATFLPSFYLFYLGKMRRPRMISAQRAVKAGVVKKVAIITLTVPGSESLRIVARQLEAMTKVSFPHDSWILVDKIHSPAIRALARSYGVKYFSRHDFITWGREQVEKWNQPTPPFKAKTKAGNVNAWLDAYGKGYSHFTQLDIDHRPHPSYLDKILGYFIDDKVAWVQAPSVYGNIDSWTARGSAEQELVLQGPLQSGFFGFCQTPFIIGSHCTYDMAAIITIGGFQPTRAEDHLDTVILAAQGKKGVFVPEILAVGDGPENFETYAAQQFAWAYSMIQVLFQYTPRCLKKYTASQALQFLFVQTWYTLWSLSMLALFSLPLVALISNQQISCVSFLDFMVHSLPMTATTFVIWFWSRKWHQPKGLWLSWRGVVLHMARWPIVLSALAQVILKVEKPYMITIKDMQSGETRPFSLVSYAPFFALILFSLLSCGFYLAVYRQGDTQGYLLFALQGAALILVVYLVALTQDISAMKKEGIRMGKSLLIRLRPIVLFVVLLTTLVATGAASASLIVDAVGYKEVKSIAQLPSDRMFLGAYDPENIFGDLRLDLESEFISWEDTRKMSAFLKNCRQKGQVPMITVEPWTTKGDNILLDTGQIVNGQALNDSIIQANAEIVRAIYPQRVLIRFAHEMDLVGNYPWSQSDYGDFIAAYRHYHDVFSAMGVTNVSWVWSPAGNANALDYYPGEEYVDYVAVTVLGHEAWDLKFGNPRGRSFQSIFNDRIAVIGEIKKPIIIAELGVAPALGRENPESYKSTWLNQAVQVFSDYPLAGVVYFNAVNASSPNGDWGRPDWRIEVNQLWLPEQMPRRLQRYQVR